HEGGRCRDQLVAASWVTPASAPVAARSEAAAPARTLRLGPPRRPWPRATSERRSTARRAAARHRQGRRCYPGGRDLAEGEDIGGQQYDGRDAAGVEPVDRRGGSHPAVGLLVPADT